MAKQCNQCGAECRDAQKFCLKCKARLPERNEQEIIVPTPPIVNYKQRQQSEMSLPVTPPVIENPFLLQPPISKKKQVAKWSRRSIPIVIVVLAIVITAFFLFVYNRGLQGVWKTENNYYSFSMNFKGNKCKINCMAFYNDEQFTGNYVYEKTGGKIKLKKKSASGEKGTIDGIIEEICLPVEPVVYYRKEKNTLYLYCSEQDFQSNINYLELKHQ